MAKFPTWTFLIICLLALEGLSQDFDLSDALFDNVPTKAHLDLSDFFDVKPTRKPITTKAPAKPKPKPKPQPAADDFDLSDALDPKNDLPGKDKGNRGGGQFSDSDLLDIAEGGAYTPDKGKGGRGGPAIPADNADYDTNAEVGTIAGVASAVAMALVGAVSSYISYQKKKFCFSVQQSLNSGYVKGENPEGVVFQEPQVHQTFLLPPNAQPPSGDSVL
ncbi:CD99 antigen-like protein 2 isoform X2 [Megalops cyprinoides]|uniref:CD99 antigen-like protein 2 isoform X2 n=1 Tax=Megalops cyprinoides TaxID=118141 RepID=UPI0018645E56|nr:CD99 antigen-like protein 2 isoform X2 [Megalops cyprinoides]